MGGEKFFNRLRKNAHNVERQKKSFGFINAAAARRHADDGIHIISITRLADYEFKMSSERENPATTQLSRRTLRIAIMMNIVK